MVSDINTALMDELILDKQEWQQAMDSIYREYGEAGVLEILRDLQNHVLASGIPLNEATLNTPYINTILPADQPAYPGDIDMEKRLENLVRWNAMAMILQGGDSGTGVGGHIATYASAATMMEVGFNHCFRARDENYGGDMVIAQPHAAPGIYARAYLEGRINSEQMKNFRRQLQPGGGLSSYPHPRLMPDFWEIPCASMGLSTPSAIYQARFAKYLENRGLKPKNGGKIWCFIGDGEADEPEVLGTINIASRENLDNLILVVNCNLQRLDGPVRGNGKIIQELERSFRGADWNVIKVIWGSGWDGLLAQDDKGILRKRMEEALDGDYQYYSVSEGDIQREHWVEGNPELERMMNSLTDGEIRQIKRGGQDPKKVYAAFQQAMASKGKPTVVLVKTVKGDGMGASAQGRNTAHQKKDLNEAERVQCGKNYGVPLSEQEMAQAQLYLPAEETAEQQYLRTHRQTLGGSLPARKIQCPIISPPPMEAFKALLEGSGERSISSTTAVVRMMRTLLKDKDIGKYIVPIVPDEARTFGMDGLFGVAGIYSPAGQQYTPVDAGSALPYREAIDGQILQEGICETGAMASFMAAGTAYAVHGLPMIPFYIFYSMFGFQRVGDMVWACGDMMCRGFLLGGTAGRTTLNGEGLQHQDGHSHVIANTYPNMKSYDPAFAYEIVVIIRDGIRRMYEQGENLFYYITVYNENHPMPAMPEGIEDDILSGLYCLERREGDDSKRVHLMSSGSIMQQALQAADQLEQLGYPVSIWSVTSFNELYRDAVSCERDALVTDEEREPFLLKKLSGEDGVFVAVTDYMKSLPNSIGQWVPGRYLALGTDGYGLSESRQDLRDYFEISPRYIVKASLRNLYLDGRIDQASYQQQSAGLGIDRDKRVPADL
ncbi:MAG: pyruvate dehydrogenase (acetyl-transferring), homodimeric type [Pseudomonadales bacterium]